MGRRRETAARAPTGGHAAGARTRRGRSHAGEVEVEVFRDSKFLVWNPWMVHGGKQVTVTLFLHTGSCRGSPCKNQVQVRAFSSFPMDAPSDPKPAFPQVCLGSVCIGCQES